MEDTSRTRGRGAVPVLVAACLAVGASGCARPVTVDVVPGARGAVVHPCDASPRDLLFRPEDAAVTKLRDLLLTPEDARAARLRPVEPR